MAKKKMTIFVLVYECIPEIGIVAKSEEQAISRIEKEKLLNGDVSASIRKSLSSGDSGLYEIDVY